MCQPSFGLLQPSMSPALNEIILVVLSTLPVPRQLLARQGRAERIGFFRKTLGGIPAWLGAEEARGFPLVPAGIPFRYPLSIACWAAGGYPAQFPFQMGREVHRWARDPVEVFHEDGRARAENLVATVNMVHAPSGYAGCPDSARLLR